MHTRLLFLLTALFVVSACALKAAGDYEWENFVGLQGGPGTVDGTGPAARFEYPSGVAVDPSSGDVFVADQDNHTIRRITTAGVATTLAGLAGSPGATNSPSGPGNLARFDFPAGVAADGSGNLYVADSANNTIRKIVIATGAVTTIAGSSISSGSTDSPSGPGSAARFDFPTSVALDANGNLYVADSGNNTIRNIVLSSTAVTTIAGSAGTPGITDSPSGPGTSARFDNPTGVTADINGNLYVADQNNFTIRKIVLSSGAVTSFAGSAGFADKVNGTGSAARFEFPSTVTIDENGDLFVADSSNHLIRKITTAGVVTTLAGSGGLNGSLDETGTAALFDFPTGIAADGNGNLYIGDANNHCIRKIVVTTGAVTTFAAPGGKPGSRNGTGTSARFDHPEGVAVDEARNVFVADTANSTVRKVTVAGVSTTFAGDPSATGVANGIGSAALFQNPEGVTVDENGNVYVADTGNHTIRKITPDRLVTTLAGSAGNDGSTDSPSGPGSAARFHFPTGLALDSDGNLFVADTGNSTIRKITSAGAVSTFAGLAGNIGSTNDTGSAARFHSPQGVAVDGDGNVFVADTGNHLIRKITSDGIVSTLAGQAGSVGSTDANGGSARFNSPEGIAVDDDGNVFVADTGNFTIRKINPAGEVSTIGGNVGIEGGVDGTGSAAGFSSPSSIAISNTNLLYVADTSNNRLTTGAPPPPDFALEQPASTPLQHSASVAAYDNVDLGTNKALEFTIRNTGGSTLTGLSVSVEGTDAADFIATTPSDTLAQDATSAFTITFTPTFSGTHTATLRVTSDDPLQPSFNITLNGTGGDFTVPTLISTTIASNNTNTSWAKPGNTATLSFSSSEPIQTPTVLIVGLNATASNTGGNNWTATFTPTLATAQGVISFSINFKDLANNSGSAVTTTSDNSTITYDRTSPTLTLPNPIFLEYTGGAGEVSDFTVTATDNLSTPVVQLSHASGSVFPLGNTTVTANATDTAGNVITGVFTVSVSVLPEDSIKPSVKILSPKANAKVFGGTGTTVILSGSTSDNLEVFSVLISFNGGPFTPVNFTANGTGGTWNVTAIPDNGTNTVAVKAFDLRGNESKTVSTSFKLVNERPLVAGAYNGLCEATDLSTTPGDHAGNLTLNVLATGAFTGKIVLGGSPKAIALSGTFSNNGTARFGKTGSSSLTIARTGKATLSLGLTLDVTSGTDKLSGTLEETGSVTVAALDADRSLYTSKPNPVLPLQNIPLALINPATDKGKYTALLQAKTPTEQGMAASAFPQGDGWARVSILKSGKAKAVGKLADGTPFSSIKPLSKANQWPFYVVLYKGKGSVSGVVSFRDVSNVSDADGPNLRWFKPANPTDKLYRNGWPNGIETDFFASKYIVPTKGSGQSALLADGETLPSVVKNGTLALSDGLLSVSTSNDISISDASKVTVIGVTEASTGVDKLKCTLSAASGVMSGTFIHPVSLKPTAFKGVVFQKQHFGSAYFIGSPAPGSPTTTTPESGPVILEREP